MVSDGLILPPPPQNKTAGLIVPPSPHHEGPGFTSTQARGQKILAYVERHIQMQGMLEVLQQDRVREKEKALPWKTIPQEEWPDALPDDVIIKNARKVDYIYNDKTGITRRIIVTEVAKEDGEVFYSVRSTKPGLDPKLGAYFIEPTLIRRDPATGHYMTRMPDGILIDSERLMTPHQLSAVKAHGTALLDGSRESEDLIAYGTGTGKSYVAAHTIQAQGGHGVLIVPDLALANQMEKELREVGVSGKIALSPEIAKSAEPKNQAIPKMLTDNKVVIITRDHLKEFAPYLYDKHIIMDEAHEYEDLEYFPTIEKICDNNDVLAITATPTLKLKELFGDPVLSVYMHQAINEFKFVRPVKVQAAQCGEKTEGLDATDKVAREQQNRNAMIREAVIGYFGRDEYYDVAPGGRNGNHDDSGGLRTVMRNAATSFLASFTGSLPAGAQTMMNKLFGSTSKLALEEMQKNKERMRFAEHKNIAFSLNQDMLQELATVYQGIFDSGKVIIGGEDITAQVCEEVANRRNQAALYQLLSIENKYLPDDEKHPLPADYRELDIAGHKDTHKSAYLKLLGDAGLLSSRAPGKTSGKRTPVNLQQEAQDALKCSIADDITDKTVSLLTGLPEKDVRRLHKAGTLSTALEKLTREYANQEHQTPVLITLRAQIGAFSEGSHLPNNIMLNIQKALEDLPEAARQQKLLDISEGKFGALLLTKEDIDLSAIKGGAEYVHMVPEKASEEEAAAVAHKAQSGRIIHLLNTHHYERGYNDPQLYHLQRFIEQIKSPVTATQVVGRVVRGSEKISAVQEIVGPNIDLNGIPGITKYFSASDVISEEYEQRAETFLHNAESRSLLKQQPGTATAPIAMTLTPLRRRDKDLTLAMQHLGMAI